MTNHENPFIFGEIIDDENFVNRTAELRQLVRDLADGQKVFLLSPRRFGKSLLVAMAMLKLKKRHIHTVSLTVSSYSSYAQFLEKFAEKVLRAAGPWDRVKDWITRFGRQVKPDVNYNIGGWPAPRPNISEKSTGGCPIPPSVGGVGLFLTSTERCAALHGTPSPAAHD